MSESEWFDGDYPTEAALEKLRSGDWIHRPLEGFVFLAEVWKYDDYTRVEIHREPFLRQHEIRFEFHTGGWSGNEDAIGAALAGRDGYANASLFLYEWRRGGHYYFSIPKVYNEATRAWKP